MSCKRRTSVAEVEQFRDGSVEQEDTEGAPEDGKRKRSHRRGLHP
jgi:hypothetical protein